MRSALHEVLRAHRDPSQADAAGGGICGGRGRCSAPCCTTLSLVAAHRLADKCSRVKMDMAILVGTRVPRRMGLPFHWQRDWPQRCEALLRM